MRTSKFSYLTISLRIMIESFIVLVIYFQNVGHFVLTHLPQVPHICVGKLGLHWRLVGAKPLSEPMLEYLFIEPLEANYNGIIIENLIFLFKKMHSKISFAKWWTFYPGRDELNNELPHVTTVKVAIEQRSVRRMHLHCDHYLYQKIYVPNYCYDPHMSPRFVLSAVLSAS